MSKTFSRIALIAGSETRFLMPAIVRRLKARHGCEIHLYCAGPQEVEFYRAHNSDGLFSTITDARILLVRAFDEGLDPVDVTARARQFEARLGITYNTLAVANRHLGRGYSLGGFHHPRSRQSEETSYLQMLHAYNETLAFWDRELTEKRITLVMNGSKELACVTRAHGLPYRALAGSRYKNYHYWACNEFYENPEFETAFHGIAAPDDADGSDTLERPYHTHLVNRTAFLKRTGIGTLARNLALTAARHAYWVVRGYEKAKGYYLRERLKYFYRLWRDYRRLGRVARTKLADLEGRPFVFFPLHVEPEAALQLLSPEFFYQLSAIAALSRDLPAGVLLAVKETFGAVGRRPDDFYGQIAEFKNVVMLETMELGMECVRRSEAVATINGTAGFEGAVMGKPVIAFGRHNIYNFLPHVTVVTDELRLGEHLAAALGDGFDAAAAARDGKQFLQAIVAGSFDMGEYNHIDVKDFEESTADAASAGLEASVAAGGEDAAEQGPQAATGVGS